MTPAVNRKPFFRNLSNYSALLLLLAGGCGTDILSAAFRPHPFVYLVVSPGGIPQRGRLDTDPAMRSLLLTIENPGIARYRTAELFRVRRASDGVALPLTETRSAEPSFQFDGVNLVDANFVLPSAAQLNPGDEILLEIATQGLNITGSTRVPSRPTPRLVTIGARRFVVFGPTAGAAGYILSSDTEAWGELVVRDTIIELRFNREAGAIPSSPEIRVTAIDTNLFSYLRDTTVSRAGLDGAYGVFGSAASARLPLPVR